MSEENNWAKMQTEKQFCSRACASTLSRENASSSLLFWDITSFSACLLHKSFDEKKWSCWVQQHTSSFLYVDGHLVACFCSLLWLRTKFLLVMFWLDPKWLNQRIREGNKTATRPCDSFQSLFSSNDSLDYMTRQSNYFGLRRVNKHFFYYKW